MSARLYVSGKQDMVKSENTARKEDDNGSYGYVPQ